MKSKKDLGEKIVIVFIIIAIFISIFTIFYTVRSLFFPKKIIDNFDSGSPSGSTAQDAMRQRLSRMGLSSFDKKLAVQFMDKNGDGQCDACGMPVEMCMDSGQMQCNMDSKSTIGVLGSQHIHADWKVYINSKALDDPFFEPLAMDMSKTDNELTSSFIHLDNGAPTPEKIGDLIHMHTTGVPLWIFFESIGMKFDKECLILNNREKYCKDNEKNLKFYVNSKENNEFGDYVFKDNDKILISYGNDNNDVIKSQINSVTDFAKDH